MKFWFRYNRADRKCCFSTEVTIVTPAYETPYWGRGSYVYDIVKIVSQLRTTDARHK